MIAEPLIREALNCPTREALAREARSVAFQAHRNAVERGDTRTINTTRRALTEATAELLRAGG